MMGDIELAAAGPKYGPGPLGYCPCNGDVGTVTAMVRGKDGQRRDVPYDVTLPLPSSPSNPISSS